MNAISLCPECGGPGCDFCGFKGTARAWAEQRELTQRASEAHIEFGDELADRDEDGGQW